MKHITPQLQQAAERWVADKVLIDLLTERVEAALQQLGDTLETESMLRAQGAYKEARELLAFIQKVGGSARSIPPQQLRNFHAY